MCHWIVSSSYGCLKTWVRPPRCVRILSCAHSNDVRRPICPQKRKLRTAEELLFGIPLDEFPVQELKQDEFECLNLNITCPAGLTPDSKIPVMVWVHGCVSLPFCSLSEISYRVCRGGDAGSGSEWYYDGGAIVRTSIFIRKPVIFVTFK
jgi:hypothetical protein